MSRVQVPNVHRQKDPRCNLREEQFHYLCPNRNSCRSDSIPSAVATLQCTIWLT